MNKFDKIIELLLGSMNDIILAYGIIRTYWGEFSYNEKRFLWRIIPLQHMIKHFEAIGFFKEGYECFNKENLDQQQNFDKLYNSNKIIDNIFLQNEKF